jgi:hypothetical protein
VATAGGAAKGERSAASLIQQLNDHQIKRAVCARNRGLGSSA